MAIHLPSLDSLHVGRYAQNPDQNAGKATEFPTLRRDLARLPI